MSHELRTPLNAVIGYSEILLEELDPERGQRRQALRPDAHQQCRKASAFARHRRDRRGEDRERHHRICSVERIDVDALLDELVETSAALVKVKKNSLFLQKSGRIGEMRSDAVKLRQILLNLIGNAAKFTSNGLITSSATRRPRLERRKRSNSRSLTPASAFRRKCSRGCSKISAKRRLKPPSCSAAPGSACRSARSSAP